MVKRTAPAPSGSTRRSSKGSKTRESAKAAASKKKPAEKVAAKKAPGTNRAAKKLAVKKPATKNRAVKKLAAKKRSATKLAAKKVTLKKGASKKAAVKRIAVKTRVKRPTEKSQVPNRAPSPRASVETKRIGTKAPVSPPRAQDDTGKNGAGVASVRAKVPGVTRGGALAIGVGPRVAAGVKKTPVRASRSAARQAIGMPERVGPGGKARHGRADEKPAFLADDSEPLSMAALDRSVRIALDGMLSCLGADTPADPPAMSADLASAQIWRWLKWNATFEDGTEMAPGILDAALSRAAADPHVESRGGLTATVLPPAVDLLRDLCLSDTFDEFSLLVARLRSE